jgi:hypothetical protein
MIFITPVTRKDTPEVVDYNTLTGLIPKNNNTTNRFSNIVLHLAILLE